MNCILSVVCVLVRMCVWLLSIKLTSQRTTARERIQRKMHTSKIYAPLPIDISNEHRLKYTFFFLFVFRIFILKVNFFSYIFKTLKSPKRRNKLPIKWNNIKEMTIARDKLYCLFVTKTNRKWYFDFLSVFYLTVRFSAFHVAREQQM